MMAVLWSIRTRKGGRSVCANLLLMMAVLAGQMIPGGNARGGRGGGSHGRSSSSFSFSSRASSYHPQPASSYASHSSYPSQQSAYHQQPAHNPSFNHPVQSNPYHSSNGYPPQPNHHYPSQYPAQPAPHGLHHPVQYQPPVVQHVVISRPPASSGSNTMLAGGGGFVAGMAANSALNRVSHPHRYHSSSGYQGYYSGGHRSSAGHSGSHNEGSQADYERGGDISSFSDSSTHWDSTSSNEPALVNRTIWLSDSVFVENRTIFVKQNLFFETLLDDDIESLNTSDILARFHINETFYGCNLTAQLRDPSLYNERISLNETSCFNETSSTVWFPLCRGTVLFARNATGSDLMMNLTDVDEAVNQTLIVNTTIIE